MQPLLKGLPKRMAILDYGLFQVHENGRIIGICGYLIETTKDEIVLIDTGFPAKYAQDHKAATLEDRLDRFGRVVSLTEDNLPQAQLAKLGLSLDDVDLMIQSHTHIDHIGCLGDFSGRPILIAASEKKLERPLYWSGCQPLEWPDAEYLLVEQDTMIGPQFEVLLVPGHAPGQLAFAFTLPLTGPVLLTSDAISRVAEMDTDFAGAWDPSQAKHHARRLMKRATKDRSMLVFGHSPEQWDALKKAPDWYV